MRKREAALEELAETKAAIRRCRRPALPPQSIARDALVRQLLEVPRNQIVVITAPAAYGKTTVIRQWEEADQRAFAWLQLDEPDNDEIRLVRHLAVALDGIDALSPTAVDVMVGAAEPPEREMVPAIVDSLEGRQPFVLVLDDIHQLHSSGARRALTTLLDQLPENCQMVLTGRTSPPLKLARRQLSSGVHPLSAGDLAMTEPEAARLLRSAGLTLDGNEVRDLLRYTEGWAGGLHLAALALARSGDHADVSGFRTDGLIAADYLVEEVLDHTAPEPVDFLERSSILEEMNPDLVNELLEIDDAAARLAQIEREGNLFLVPVDRGTGSYRYHGMFRDVLRNRLRTRDATTAARLEAHAAKMCESLGDVDGAIRHAVAAGDPDYAAGLVLSEALDLVMIGRTSLLAERLDQLPTGMSERNPAAALATAWHAISTGDAETTKRAMRSAEHADGTAPLGHGSPSVSVVLAVIRSMLGWNGTQGVVQDTQIVRDGGPPAHNRWWSVATLAQGTAYSMLGESELARERFLEVVATIAESPAEEAVVMAHLANLSLEDGDLAEADRYATRARHVMERFNLHRVLLTIAVYPVVALASARSGRIDEAERAAERAREMLETLGFVSPRSALFAHLVLAEAALAMGNVARAREHATEAERTQRREKWATFLNERLEALTGRLQADGRVRPSTVPLITPAELRVLNRLSSHLSLKEIAAELVVSRNTVKSHTVAIYRKLGVSSRSEAVTRARELGILAGSRDRP